MKSLQTIQKTFRVFCVLTKIAMILSFVGAGLAALGMFCAVVWYYGGSVVGVSRELLYSITETCGMNEMVGVLLTDIILSLTDGILFAYALKYFNMEQADGTPFTKRGAEEIKNLGIRTIVLPLVAAILCAIVFKISGMPQDVGGDWSNLDSVCMGIVLLIASLIFQYGAELELHN